MLYKISPVILLFIFVLSCKNDVSQNTGNDVKSLEKAVSKLPNGENINKLLMAYNKEIINPETERSDRKQLLEKAYDLTDKQGWDKEQIGFATSYIREFPDGIDIKGKVRKLIDLMEKRNIKVTVNALKYSYLEAYPEAIDADSIKQALGDGYKNAEEFLKVIAEKVFENPDDIGINIRNGREYVNACEAYVMVLPVKTNAPRYLFNASEISRTIKTTDKTLYLYDWIIDKYPQYEKAPMAMFLKGFILENDVKNVEKAKEVYRKFLESYPSHDLADDVQFLLDNIGKSNEEILKMIEENKKK